MHHMVQLKDAFWGTACIFSSAYYTHRILIITFEQEIIEGGGNLYYTHFSLDDQTRPHLSEARGAIEDSSSTTFTSFVPIPCIETRINWTYTGVSITPVVEALIPTKFQHFQSQPAVSVYKNCLQ